MTQAVRPPAVLLCLLLVLMAAAPVVSAVEVDSVNALQVAVSEANGGGDRRILIAPGTYRLGGVQLRLTAEGIHVAGKTGRRADVIIDGEYSSREIFQIVASDTTIRDLTLQRALDHPLHIVAEDADVVGTRIVNVHIVDPGQQAIKINQNSARTHSVNYGLVENSLIELTDAGRTKVWQRNGSCYTGGIDAHHARGWRIAGNVIRGFWCADGLAEHGIHFWSDSSDTVVEGNSVNNCDRGIGFGLGSSGHTGGSIQNNMIYHDAGHDYSDVGIGLESAVDARVINNTVFHEHAYANAIEYRFAASRGVYIQNNLSNRAVSARDGASGVVSHNVTTAVAGWFRDAGGGDLHLRRAVAGVVDSGVAVAGVSKDFDGDRRPVGKGVDIGADEWSAGGETFSGCPWLLLLLSR